MTETRSIFTLNDKITYLSQTSDQHDQELHGIHQKLDTVTSMFHQRMDVVTGMLQTLSQTVQGLTEVSSQWQRQSTPPQVPSSPNHQDTTLATIPQSEKLEFPKFRGENPSSWVYKAYQFFQLYDTPPNQKILLASYHMEKEALIWF